MKQEYDVMVDWTRPDGSTIELPATVGGFVGEDVPLTRMTAACSAVDANLVDFPDDLPEGSIVRAVRFENVTES